MVADMVDPLSPTSPASQTPGNVFACHTHEANREAFSVKFSSSSLGLLAGTHADGSIGVLNVSQAGGGLVANLKSGFNFPATAAQFRPGHNDRPILATCAGKATGMGGTSIADGLLQFWHVQTAKPLQEIVEKDNHTYCFDYFADGSKFATAGLDRRIHVYDEVTKREILALHGGDSSKMCAGHSNRVFSLHWHPNDPNLLVSGGWDFTIQFWDIRREQSVRSIYGSHICGDAVDISGDGSLVLAGSHRTEVGLQVFDFGSGNLVRNVKWASSKEVNQAEMSGTAAPTCSIFCAKFSKADGGKRIAAGGLHSNEIRIFNYEKDKIIRKIPLPMLPQYGVEGVPDGDLRYPGACYSLDINDTDQLVATADSGGAVQVVYMHMRHSS